MRKAFGEVCLGDAEFFEEEGSDATVDLSALASPDFDFQLDDGDTAKLTEIIYKLPQQHAPTFSIRSKDAFATLEMNGMRAALEDALSTGAGAQTDARVYLASLHAELGDRDESARSQHRDHLPEQSPDRLLVVDVYDVREQHDEYQDLIHSLHP